MEAENQHFNESYWFLQSIILFIQLYLRSKTAAIQ
ncbi:MAG: hypothetical protein RLZZ236_308 [Bacteroidota bacterium]|jgi:hypothetical protein